MFSAKVEPLRAFRGRKVTVMGLGLFGGGQGVTEFLCRQGAEVTVTDLRSEEVLQPTARTLASWPIRWRLGEHREEDFLGADLVVANPAIPRSAPLLELCRRRRIPLETETNLFFKYCRGKICAVTGSNGKTTTTSLIAAMASRAYLSLRVGGNMGLSLLPDVDSIAPQDWVVLELSNFQLEDLSALARRPEVSVVTNLSPNHLDRHGTYEAYLKAKQNIIDPGPPPNVAVLNAEDAMLRLWAGNGRAGNGRAATTQRRVVYFGRTGDVVPQADGVWLGATGARSQSNSEPLFDADDVPLLGSFNRLNAAAAAAAALAMGIPKEEIKDGLRHFQPVEHRLEPITEADGIRYVNDSVSTTPESTRAALEALGPKVVLICGGASKGCSFRELGGTIARRARGVVLLGQTAEEIRAAIPPRRESPPVYVVPNLEQAVKQARGLAETGDTILLSPACPSYDQFTNFVERGRRFKEIVSVLAPAGMKV